jgi:hypothetical protein
MMTEREKFMYKLLGNISSANAPIIFKGALIKNLVLAEHGYNEIYRETKDIDCNWVDTPPSMNVLVDIINQSLGNLQNEYYATAEREYGEKKSAGINIIKIDTGEEIVLMDISMKPVIGSKIYYYGEMSIKGVLPNEILADKISVLSSNYIFRRTKDMIDIYALSHCIDVQTIEIFDIYEKNKRELQDFNAFLNRKAELEHAYNKLMGVEGKPDFVDIYLYLNKFLNPFIQRENNKVWNSKTESWQDFCQKIK